jgi:NAD kinase
MICLGGDGVVLYANKFLRTIFYQGSSPPILAVNLGTLGFLSQFSKEEFHLALKETFVDKEPSKPEMNLLCVPKVVVEVFSSSGILFKVFKTIR